MSIIGKIISQFFERIQVSLFPWLEEELDPLTKKQMQLVTILKAIQIDMFIPVSGWMGRPTKFRAAIARAFITKSVYNMDTTWALIDRLQTDKNLRRICGFENKNDLPSESTFSRAFDEFANSKLPQRIHEDLIKEVCKEDIIQHISNDSTAIEAREKPNYQPEEKKEDKKFKTEVPLKNKLFFKSII